VDPRGPGRLDDIRDNVRTQAEEAQRNQWLGDVNQLQLTIEHADRKAARLITGMELQPNWWSLSQQDDRIANEANRSLVVLASPRY
jgi:hypothetical protein